MSPNSQYSRHHFQLFTILAIHTSCVITHSNLHQLSRTLNYAHLYAHTYSILHPPSSLTTTPFYNRFIFLTDSILHTFNLSYPLHLAPISSLTPAQSYAAFFSRAYPRTSEHWFYLVKVLIIG